MDVSEGCAVTIKSQTLPIAGSLRERAEGQRTHHPGRLESRASVVDTFGVKDVRWLRSSQKYRNA